MVLFALLRLGVDDHPLQALDFAAQPAFEHSASGPFGMNKAISAVALIVDGPGVAYKRPIHLKHGGVVDCVGDERTVCRPIQTG